MATIQTNHGLTRMQVREAQRINGVANLQNGCVLTYDFDIWVDGAPFVTFGGDNDFNLWVDGAPFIDNGDSCMTPPSVPIRRRATFF